MPKFSYEAIDSQGKIVKGKIEAQSRDVVFNDLKASKYTITYIKEETDLMSSLNDMTKKFQKVNLYVLAIFTRQFSVLFNAGLPLTKSLDALGNQALSPKLSETIESVSKDIKSGFSLSRSLAKHPDVFSPVYISLIKAGEMAGALGEVLDRLASLMERDNALRKKIAASLSYPMFVLAFALIVVVGLVLYIFPQFVEVFKGMDVQLPLVTRILIMITELAMNPIFIVCFIVGCVVFYILVNQYTKTGPGRRHKDMLILQMPVVGPINKKTVMSRFCRTLGTLISSGVPVVHALEIVSRAVGNDVISGILEEVKSGLKAGLRLSQPLIESDMFPPIVGHMISVGEETGNIAHLMDKLAIYFDQEIEYDLQSFSSIIEPVMIIGLGSMVAFILLAVFSPIYSLVQQF